MAIFSGSPYNLGGTQVGAFPFLGSGIQAQSNDVSQQTLGLGSPAGIIQVLQQLMQSLEQLSQGWGGLLGQQQHQQFPFAGQTTTAGTNFGGAGTNFGGAGSNFGVAGSNFGGAGSNFGGIGSNYGGAGTNFGGAGSNVGGAGSNYTFPNFLPPGAVAPSVSTGGGLYGGTSINSGAPQMPFPSDSGDYASYLQAQVAGGALQGQTSVNQFDGIPGTRFYSVQPSQLWQANVGRQYAYQFAAEANGLDPLSPQGLAHGAQAMQQMNPESQLFMQVASVFKGNLDGGPGNYDNAGLKQLLIDHGAGDLTNKAGVGQTDVQTIGAVAAAINRGQLNLQDIINSGTIDNLDRYGEIINYVQSGNFQSDLNGYDHY